ncbi:glucose-1-phosphate thymidylyltransferase [Candidatus Bathyarchaeota archaeon]|nr:glucose-1-phosphate thymidylyltransferase [Candidatus Bathyarchaeota archaeon]
MKGLLLAGGSGTRLRPLTFTGNKHALPIANKPMILYGLEQLKGAGIKEIGVILGPIKEGMLDILGDGSKYGVKITYIEQPEPRGLAHAVLISEDYLGDEPFVMYLGDNLLRQPVRNFVTFYDDEKADCVIGATEVKNPEQYGVIVFRKDGAIERLVEKPREPISNWALIGVYIFNHKIFHAVKKIRPSWRGELEITDAIQALLSDGATVKVQKVDGWWKDTGSVGDLLEANRLILDDLKPERYGSVDDGANIHGRVSLGRNSSVSKGARIMGPSILGNDTSLAEGVYVGPYTSIGNNVAIKRGEVENSIIMDGCVIDTDERIVDSLIGPSSLITSKTNARPRGKRLVVGERSTVEF